MHIVSFLRRKVYTPLITYPARRTTGHIRAHDITSLQSPLGKPLLDQCGSIYETVHITVSPIRRAATCSRHPVDF